MKYNGKYSLKSLLKEIKIDLASGRRAIIDDTAFEAWLDNGTPIDREKHLQMFQMAQMMRTKRRYQYGEDASEGATLIFGTKIIIPAEEEGAEPTIEAGTVEVVIPWPTFLPQITNPETDKISQNKTKWKKALTNTIAARIKPSEDGQKIRISKTLGIDGDAGAQEFEEQDDAAAFFIPDPKPSGRGGYSQDQVWEAFMRANGGEDAWQQTNKDKMMQLFEEFTPAEIALEKQREVNENFEKLLADCDAGCKEKLNKLTNKLSQLGPPPRGSDIKPKDRMKGHLFAIVGDALFLEVFMDENPGQAAKNILDACFTNPAIGDAPIPIPDVLKTLADTDNPSRSDTVGKGEFVSHFMWDDTKQNLGADELDVVINGQGWHVKAIAGRTKTAPLGKQTFASSGVASAMVGLAKKHGWSQFPREFAVRDAEENYVKFLTDPEFPASFQAAGGPANTSYVDDAGIVRGGGYEDDRQDPEPATPEQIRQVAVANSKMLSDLITKQMREMNFAGKAEGVMFYEEKAGVFVFKKGDTLHAQNVTQSAHRVGKLDSQQGYYDLSAAAQAENSGIAESDLPKLWEWAVTGKRTWK